MHNPDDVACFLSQANASGDTALHVAVKHKHDTFSLALIDQLLKYNVPIEKVDVENQTEKMTPFFIAVLKCRFKVAVKLLATGLCDPKRKNSEGKTVFKIAMDHKCHVACQFLEALKGSQKPEPPFDVESTISLLATPFHDGEL